MGIQSVSRLETVAGIRVGTLAGGLKKNGKLDLAVILCEPGSRTACCFTRNRFQAAPIQVAKAHLARSPCRALVINTVNANAGTGEAGVRDAEAVCRTLARLLSIEPESVLPFSTGVIGQPLPLEAINNALPKLLSQASPDGWVDAAHAIMTTDTVAKGASRQCTIGGVRLTVTGIAKGSGMIRPDMATMLAFIGTDAAIEQSLLEEALTRAMDKSFHCITVDGDTSTNDACALTATGGSGVEVSGKEDLELFQAALDDVCVELAQGVIRDAEGAEKFIAISVDGAADDDEARAIAFTVAHSPLVKTALFASDANWGRILAAVGRAPVASLDVGRVCLSINGCAILRDGEIDRDYDEASGTAAMAPEEIEIEISVGSGPGRTTIWTSDLSHGYVRINAEYRS